MKDIEIRRVTREDIAELQKISSRTFYETFSPHNTAENMRLYLKERFSIERLTQEIDNKDSEFWFATAGNDVIGYLKVNSGKAQTELQDDRALEIERIYVVKEFHGKNVGKLLFEKALNIAEEKNTGYIWLGVWEKNFRASNFYRKNGFREFDRHKFVLGNDTQTDIMMKLTLNSNNVGQ